MTRASDSHHKTKSGRPPKDTVKHGEEPATAVDGPKIIAHDESTELALGPELEDFSSDEDELTQDVEEPTLHRGSKPPRPSSSRRLSPTLMKIFQRRREQIGLSIEQVSKLSGIEVAEIERFEGTNGGHRLLYDHAVVLARVLGVKPQDMPGLRNKDTRDPVRAHLEDLQRALHVGPQLVLEGKSGERYGGDIERVITTPAFSVKLGDASLGAGWPKGALLAFTAEAHPQPGDVVLLRHKKSKLLALRRLDPPSWAGLVSWQPAYVSTGGEWLPVGRLEAVLPRAR